MVAAATGFLALDACIAALLALGFGSDDASNGLAVDDSSNPHLRATAAAIARFSAGFRTIVVTAFESDREARVESPCIRHCTLDDDDICLGCFRSIDEICAWGAADNAERREILINATRRRESRAPKRG